MAVLPGLQWYPTQAARRPLTQTQDWRLAQPTPTGFLPSTRSAQALPPAPHPRRHSLSPHHLRRDSQRRLCLLHRSVSAGRLQITAAPQSPATRSRGQPTAVLVGAPWWQTQASLGPPTPIPGWRTPRLTRTGSPPSTRLGLALLPTPHPQQLLLFRLHRADSLQQPSLLR